MDIRVWDYSKEYEEEKTEILSALERVLDSGWLILGEEVKSFEREFSTYCGVQHGVGVNSGTDALFLGLKALGIGNGDEVITVSNTAIPTVSAIISTGAKPRFVDVDEETFLMNTSQITEAITDETKCILPVHLFGQCVDMDPVVEIADSHGLKILEDCAQCHGAQYKGRNAGSLGDISAFSFYPTKILGGYGDGGMVITDSKDLHDHLLRLRFYGVEKSYFALEHGYNSRLDEMHAAILLGKLNHLDSYIERRQFLAGQYDEMLSDCDLILPRVADGNDHAYYLYVCRHPERDRIIKSLSERNIHVNISYPWPIHTMDAYNNLGYGIGDLPVTEKLANEIFSLPLYPSLLESEQLAVCDALKDLV